MDFEGRGEIVLSESGGEIHFLLSHSIDEVADTVSCLRSFK